MIPTSAKPRVLLADVSERAMQVISRLLMDEFEVVGCVQDGEEAVKAVIRLKPDVIVMEIVMPKADGIQASRRLKKMNLSTKVVFLSALNSPDYIDASLGANGSAFVFKSRAARDLALAIREVLAGRTFVST